MKGQSGADGFINQMSSTHHRLRHTFVLIFLARATQRSPVATRYSHRAIRGIRMSEQSTKEYVQHVIEQVEKLMQERVELNDDIRAIYAQAKSEGLNPKALKKLIAIRKMDASDYEELEMDTQLYAKSIGMKPLPLLDLIEMQKAKDGEKV